MPFADMGIYMKWQVWETCGKFYIILCSIYVYDNYL